MSTLWTPGGEHPVSRRGEDPAATQPPPGPPTGEPPANEEELRAQLAAFQEELARAPAEAVVANHAFGLFELAALHLSQDPPHLDEARLAIDAFAALVEGLGPRLGEAAPQLSDGLAQLRMAFVQVHAAQQAGGDAPADGG